jgi:uncharacterized phage protein (TIGR01671 family)
MREIKFRAWDTAKNYFDFDPLICGGKACYIDSFDALEDYKEGRIILQQYTGLKDKNGKEIYEGDICLNKNIIYEVRWVESSAKIGVKIVKTDYILSRGCTFPIQQYVNDGTLECAFEVIGNIYENPELLKESENK